MRIIIAGPGRAGTALAKASRQAGHRLAGVVGKDRSQTGTAAADLDAPGFVPGEPLPAADLLLVCTRDALVAPVAAALGPGVGQIAAAAHVSGLLPVTALRPLGDAGLATGAFHPLQTLPTGEAGAARLPGAWIAVTATEPLRGKLFDLAESLGGIPFDLGDDVKPVYHAAAAAAANFPLVALAMAGDLLDAAGVPFAAARPLVEGAVANAFELGPRPSLTGPVARGDIATVRTQLDAVAATEPGWVSDFAASLRAIARLTGRREQLDDLLDDWEPPRRTGDDK